MQARSKPTWSISMRIVFRPWVHYDSDTWKWINTRKYFKKKIAKEIFVTVKTNSDVDPFAYFSYLRYLIFKLSTIETFSLTKFSRLK